MISQLNLTFNEIIYNYRKQPQCKPQVFESMFVDWLSSLSAWENTAQQDHVDIIIFDHKVFVPVVKPLLVELGPARMTAKTNWASEVNYNNDGIIVIKLIYDFERMFSVLCYKDIFNLAYDYFTAQVG